MHPVLQQKIGQLAAQFAEGIVNLLQDQPLSMLTGGGSGTAPKMASTKTRAPRASSGGRRGPEEMQELIEKIVEAVKAAPEGLRSEQIQKVTGLAKREIVRPLQLALKGGLLRKVGEKRSTSYFSPTVGGAAPKRKAAAKKASATKAAAKKASAKPKTKTTKKKAAPKRAAAKKTAAKHVNSAPAPQTEATT